MHALIIIVHLIVCFALILIVLLQTGKGANMGAMFGGAGNQTLFGNTGASTFLSKATTIAAVVFMMTSLSLAYVSRSGSDSVISDYRPAAEEQQAPAADQPQETSPGVEQPQTPSPGDAPGSASQDPAPVESPDVPARQNSDASSPAQPEDSKN